MFQTVPLSIIRSFSQYTQQRYVIKLASRIRTEPVSTWSCSQLLMMDRGTVQNIQGFIPKIN